MKVMSSLVIALLAILSVLASATINPVELAMVANVSQLSIATAEFKSITNENEGGRQGQVAFFLPGHFSSPAYEYLDCTTAISLNNITKFAIRRSTVSKALDPSGFTRLNHDLNFNNGHILGNFKTACSFVAPNVPRDSGAAAHASVAVGVRTAMTTNYNTIVRPSRNLNLGFSAFISDNYNMNKPSAFRITGANILYAHDNQFIVRNPSDKDATTGSRLSFATYRSTASCDVHWDGVLYPNSGQVSVMDAGKYLRFTLGSPLNVAKEIVVYCDELRGTAFAAGFYGDYARFFPSALELVYGPHTAFTVAYTRSRPSSADFEAGFTTISPFPYFTPKSVAIDE